jgi:hypothetical protein
VNSYEHGNEPSEITLPHGLLSASQERPNCTELGECLAPCLLSSLVMIQYVTQFIFLSEK